MEIVTDPITGKQVEVVRNSDLKFGTPRRGKVRDVYDLGQELLIYHTDRISAFDVVMPTLIPHKGESLLKLSVYWMERSRKVFPNHFIEALDSRTIRVRKAKRIDVEWVVRKYLYGSLWRAYRDGRREMYGLRFPDGLRMAEELPEPVLTPTTKADVGHDEEISKEEAIAKGLVDRETWKILEEATLKLYEFYQSEAKRRGIIIPDFKIEFGIAGGELIQIDEPPTHDSARMWSLKHYRPGEPQESHCLDKEFLRECLRRMCFSGDGKPPELPVEVVREISKRCIGAYKVISGESTLEDLALASVDDLFKK
ncbi:MAG: phosphoribosylaminoimidazolesuccinocarboxamide synthase [Candidatus Verstraetearchaeota archaeon]|nr:phosphoribosylaminoimidazolesuccinocarboxamide synthase [Candidatus Verstraetearchaeota archaeon]